MGIDIGGIPVIQSGGGITLNSSLFFNSAGQGAANPYCGYAAWCTGGTYYYSAPTGWPLNAATWQSGLNLSNGVFTCPVAGFYAMGYNGIHNAGSNNPVGYNCYGYSGFAKNGALSYFVHWNLSASNAWNTGGCSALFQCAAGDTLALFVNRAPSPVGPNAYDVNTGLYPSEHHCVWCKLVG